MIDFTDRVLKNRTVVKKKKRLFEQTTIDVLT